MTDSKGRKVKVYLASPLGFTEAGIEFLDKKLIPGLESLGFTVTDPWKAIRGHPWSEVFPQARRLSHTVNMSIGRKNADDIVEADMVVAVLDGPDVDSGVATEIGFAFANGKRIVGYRSDFRNTGDNRNAKVNLQVESFVADSGGAIVNSVQDLFRYLGRFATSEGPA